MNNNMQTQIQQRNIKNLLTIIISIIILIGGIFLGYKFLFKNEENSKDFDINVTTAFFLKNSDYKYALFNEEGKQLTDFIYTRVGNFVNGTVQVEIDKQEGIINEAGKDVVPLGKYNNIIEQGGLYQVSENNEGSYNKYLIDNNGDILYDLKNAKISKITNNDIMALFPVESFLILEMQKENKYVVINYKGKELFSFPKVKESIGNPLAKEEKGYGSIFYNNNNIIFNVNTGKQLASFSSDLFYCVNDVSEDGSVIVLESYINEFQNETYYKFIKNGKLYDKTNECNRVYEDSGSLICYKDHNNEYLLDSNLNIGVNISRTAYQNGDTYATENSKDHSVDFYQDGKIVKNVPCRVLKSIGYLGTDVYILGTEYNTACGTKSDIYEYYSSNGEKLFDKSFDYATKFDSNVLAIAREEKNSYFLIDKFGNQKGHIYNRMESYFNYYKVHKNELVGIVNKDGKEIIPCEYSKIDNITYKNERYAKLTTIDSKYVIYDLEKNKEVLRLDVSPNMNSEHYITIYLNNKKQYYTYDGKLFYEE